MTENKTLPTEASVIDFINSVENKGRREDAHIILELMEKVSGYKPVMWGESIIGFGQYAYQYDSGHSGIMIRTGFSPRKANMVLYIMPGYDDYGEILARVGKYKMGKSCLYLGRLKGINLEALEELVAASLEKMDRLYPN